MFSKLSQKCPQRLKGRNKLIFQIQIFFFFLSKHNGTRPYINVPKFAILELCISFTTRLVGFKIQQLLILLPKPKLPLQLLPHSIVDLYTLHISEGKTIKKKTKAKHKAKQKTFLAIMQG